MFLGILIGLAVGLALGTIYHVWVKATWVRAVDAADDIPGHVANRVKGIMGKK